MDANNTRKDPGSATLPAITLAVLVALIFALLYIGYEYVADNTGSAEELTNVSLDTTTRGLGATGDPELINPLDTLSDTTNVPVPVDLSQAEPPIEEAARPERPEAAPKEKPEEKAPVDKGEKLVPAPGETKPAAKVTPKPGGIASTHTVDAGETFYGIANRYNMKVSTLKELNPDVPESQVKTGVTRLKIKALAVHTVGPGDVLRVVAQKYGVSKEAIMRANGKTKDLATRGEKLVIPFPEKQ